MMGFDSRWTILNFRMHRPDKRRVTFLGKKVAPLWPQAIICNSSVHPYFYGVIFQASKMIALQCHSRIPIFLNLSHPPSSSYTFKPLSYPIFGTKLSVPNQFYKSRNLTNLRRSKFSDGVNTDQDPSFFNENGAVEDMDSYLNHLSLEYDSVWDTKPSWCQPWTIGLTGIGIITGSWLVLNSIVVTAIVATLICLWWYIFLYSYPKAYSDMITERRNKVTSGQEDIYGMKAEQ
ncbi:hypothetical protein CASFOL_029635 [Castilleja foliolosa]|uniref:DUF6737 domain-containing protein n=1 Tax=Castilleja foliolosa TaxID=1961234 RepID=A0ABD3C9T4_9LAMI